MAELHGSSIGSAVEFVTSRKWGAFVVVLAVRNISGLPNVASPEV
jgi:hypothetical protein